MVRSELGEGLTGARAEMTIGASWIVAADGKLLLRDANAFRPLGLQSTREAGEVCFIRHGQMQVRSSLLHSGLGRPTDYSVSDPRVIAEEGEQSLYAGYTERSVVGLGRQFQLSRHRL